MSASWYDPETVTPASAVRHAPDDNHYHLPDSRMLDRMPAGRSGTFAVIPAAAKDGASKGFDPHTPGAVHVDPNAPDGGVIVDLSQLDAGKLQRALHTSAYPHEVFYKLGSPVIPVQQAIAAEELPRVNPVMPNAYVVPKSSSDGTQLFPLAARSHEESRVNSQVVPAPALMPLAAPLPLSQPMHPTQYANPGAEPYQQPTQPHHAPTPAPVLPAEPVQALLTSVVNNLNMLNQRMQAIEERAAPPRALPPPPAQLVTLPVGRPVKASSDGTFEDTPKPIPRHQTLKEYEQDQKVGDQTLIVGFETLRIAFINGPVGNRPKQQVFFEFEGIGKQSAWFHDVIDRQRCVVLAYDTRYEGGAQYLPPDLGDAQIRLHVPHLKKKFVVSSMALEFTEGVIDYVLLIKHSEEHFEYEGSGG